jgi:hypothetical protein
MQANIMIWRAKKANTYKRTKNFKYYSLSKSLFYFINLYGFLFLVCTEKCMMNKNYSKVVHILYEYGEG